MYYSIFLNKLVCKCLNDAAFNSTELEHFTGRQLLVGRNIDQQTRAQLQYELSRKLLDKIGTPSQEVCRILPELENSKDEFIQVDIGLPMFSRMLFEPIPQAHMVLERQYERKIAHRSIGSLDLDARSVRSVQTALLLTANCDVQEFVDRCAVTVDVGDKEVINMKYPQAWYAAIQNLLSPKKSGEAVPQQLPLHWLCENTFGDELTNLQRILCADPIQLLGTLQKCLAAFVEPQRDTATSNIAGYMDVLGQFPAFSKLKQAFDTFQKAAVDGTEAELPKLRKPLEDAAKEYEARKRVTVGADGEAVQQEIAPADKIEQVLQNKSLTREQKATLVKFALDENGFLSDKFLSTKF
jgi:hypothetical protein